MKILVSYSSKWSAEFADPITHKNKVVSLAALNENPNKLDVILDENDTYETTMLKIGNAYNNFVYKTISKNTVLGIISRLIGEVRYLDKIDPKEDHPINKIMDKVSFNLHDRELYNEIISLAKPITKVQSNGGGLINSSKSNFLLLSDNDYSKIIFSLFNLKTLEDIDSFVSFIEKNPTKKELLDFINDNKYSYNDKIELYQFVKNHNDHASLFNNIDKNYVKYKKYQSEIFKGNPVDEDKVVTLDEDLSYYITLLDRIALYTGKNIDSDGKYNAYSELGPVNDKNSAAVLNIIGLLYYFVIAWTIKGGNKQDIDESLINKNGNIAGIATNSGKITVKDFYGFVSPRKLSWSMPYMFDSKYLKKKEAKQFNQSNTTLGVGKESGVLEIIIDIPTDEAVILHDQIKAAAVSTFHVGKKGLAYVKGIEINE